MRQRKVSQLLLLFTEEDLNEFQTFLLNPAISAGKTLALLLGQFRKTVLPLEEGEDVSLENFLSGTDINPRRVDKLCSRLNTLARDFLAQKQFKQNEHLQIEMLAQAIEERSSGSKEAERLYERIGHELESAPQSANNFLNLLNLSWLQAEAAIKSRQTRALWQEDFRDLHQLLDQYYHLQKLRLISATTNARTIFNLPENDAQGILPVTSDPELQQMNDGPLAHAYILVIRMLRDDPSASHFEELLGLLEREAHRFAHMEGLELYGYALNFCIMNSNLGRLEYLEHASALYIQLLDNKLLLSEGQLSPGQFKNIVALHCQLGKLDWTQGFIDRYADLLPPESREFALQYNRAVLDFYRQEYARCIQQFREVIHNFTDDVFYGIDARVYLWKSYFEHYDHLSIDEVDEMYRLYDAFRLYIDRNEKIAAAHKQHYRHFIRAFKRLVEILRATPLSRKDLEELRVEVEETDSISNKKWMLEKIDHWLGR